MAGNQILSLIPAICSCEDKMEQLLRIEHLIAYALRAKIALDRITFLQVSPDEAAMKTLAAIDAMTSKRIYLCKCHDKPASHNKSGGGLGTWRCPITRKKAPVRVEKL